MYYDNNYSIRVRGGGYRTSNPEIFGNSNNSAIDNSSIMGPAAIAGIQAGASILGGILGSGLGYHNSKRLMKLQAEQQKEQFDYTNEYNLPINQVKRLIDAGLNPNLLYGSSHVTGNTSGMPQVSSPHASSVPVDLNSAIKYSLDAMRLEKENRLVDQQIENMRQQNRALSIQNDIAEETKPWSIEQKFYELQNIMNNVSIGEINSVLLSNKRVRDDFATEIYGKLIDEGLAEDIERSKYYMDMQSYYIALNQQEYMEKQIDKLAVDIANAAKEGRILDYKANLADMGINPDDPVWMRAIALVVDKLLNYFGYDASDIIRAGVKAGSNLVK